MRDKTVSMSEPGFEFPSFSLFYLGKIMYLSMRRMSPSDYFVLDAPTLSTDPIHGFIKDLTGVQNAITSK